MAHSLVSVKLLALLVVFLSNLTAARIVKRAVAPPTTLPGSWKYLGCYTDSVNTRSLGGAVKYDGSTLTDESCIAFCTSQNFVYAGTEYSGECYCGNTLGGTKAADADCNMACSGSATEACGGPNRLTVFGTVAAPPASSSTTTSAGTNPTGLPAGWVSAGCYSDSVNARALTNPVYGGSDTMTPTQCINSCVGLGYIFAGTEYAGECYCGNAISNGQGPVTDGGCNMACNGDATQICGGPNRLSVFKKGTAPPPPTTTTSSTTSSSPVATTLPTGWKYSGCYKDGVNGRILPTQLPDSSTMTIESCVANCIAAGYTVAGMEYSTQCFCGKNLINGASLAATDGTCAMTCGGNSKEVCGGPNLASVYYTGTLVIKPVPAIQKSGLPANWVYKGCISDNAVTRTFPYQINWDTNNTAPACMTLCQQYKYGSAGVEFGSQCFCGDYTDITAAGATYNPDGDCNTICTGNDTAYCGGPNRIAYYEWAGATPLNSWKVTTGNAAGQYQFLIGGLVVPLVTTLGVNGKVTFVEKHGTGPPNSTGAYELDVSLASNFNKAWRTMHVKTDVFCSASLTLPDKVGRQINIGGWANDATYGVRLYWPNGSPGVNGTNDWQENVAELSLMKGRWYPTAMIMSNGSILVVGGEEGSNGAPVPSLEILPRPAGVTQPLFCDYLNRTDPYNLYPFLYTMPTGDIFIAYYNEARLLDPITLGTKKVLPNIPAAVNNFLGGRSYPFEGTSVIWPQKAPYTDPVTVTICGGSVPGPEIALDNCASLTPTVTGASWVIERMPSKRVMTCMAGLPDGTFLILNGAQHGTAGFGRGSLPNHNALLFDPTKAVNSRFSILANTTIDRLYHSEAILLQDGRVLVTGSDPENDVNNPFGDIEYRVEVFIPPYLMGNPVRPSYAIAAANKNWAYGTAYQITNVVIPSGSTANLKVSLIGMVSSTHGNNMGDRIIFPAFTCSGTTCTITAPPDNKVCPPGWFQLFILDKGVPSISTFVRIGGDPAKLGNWPNFADFTVPGL